MIEIPDKMKALVGFAPKEYKLIHDYPVPSIGDHDFLIKIDGCGICGSDLKCFNGAEAFWSGFVKPPFIPGHEFVGKIVKKGSCVSEKYNIGDAVTVEPTVPCGECIYCRKGNYGHCIKCDEYGFQNKFNGGMAEYMVVKNGSRIVKIPGGTPLEKAVLTEPFSCAKHGIDNIKITVDDVVVLAGAGAIGLAMIGHIKMRNPRKLIVLDMKEERLKMAKQFGADVVINPSTMDVEKKVMNLTEGLGCDVYIEATGHPASVQQGLNIIGHMGRFLVFGVFNKPVDVNWTVIGDIKEITIVGSHNSPFCFEPTIEMIAKGKIPTDGIVTHKFSLDEWERAFSIAEKGDCIKVILEP